MRINIACVECRKSLALPAGFIGRVVQCPACRATFTAQDPSITAERPEPTPIPALSLDEPPQVLEETPFDFVPKPSAEFVNRLPPRTPRSFRPFVFTAIVISDSLGQLSGKCRAETALGGLWLRRSGGEVFLPTGTAAQYAGGNRLHVALPDRELKLTVRVGLGSNRKLARGLVGYLTGIVPSLPAREYRVSGYLVGSTLLPLLPAIPSGLLGDQGLLIGGACAAVLALLVAFQLWLAMQVRLSLVLGITGASAIPSLLFLSTFIWGYNRPIRNWEPFEPPGAGCRINFPGPPSLLLGGGEHTTYGRELPERRFSFLLGHSRVEDMVPSLLRLQMEVEELFREFPAHVVREVARPVSFLGHPGQEVRIDFGNVQGVVRIYVMGKQVYVLTAIGPKFTPQTRHVTEFFDSFELLDQAK